MAQGTESAVMKYEARDGQEITLTFDIVRRYLVQGHPEFVTVQEFMYFMGVCQSQGMNPFKRDCYLLKYTKDDPAAIITAIDFLRSRAKAQPDCRGWKAVIILQVNGNVEYREGTLILDGEKLVGGWFQAKPAGWDEPVKWTVPLKTYIKHKKDGGITRFWQPDNQPGQISKVCESQGLRKCWPSEFQNLYTDAEISPDDGMRGLPEIPENTTEGESGETVDADAHEEFDAAVATLKGINLDHLNKYVTFGARVSDKTVYEFKQEAIERFNEFLASFQKWEPKNYPIQEKGESSEVDKIRMSLEAEDLRLYDELKNVKGSSLEVRVARLETQILNASPQFQEWLEKTKWANVYKGSKAYPFIKKENAATGQDALPGGDSEGETEPLADDDEKYPIKCTNKEVAADRVYADYCEGRCRFREKADGSVCEDYLNYVDELTGRE